MIAIDDAKDVEGRFKADQMGQCCTKGRVLDQGAEGVVKWTFTGRRILARAIYLTAIKVIRDRLRLTKMEGEFELCMPKVQPGCSGNSTLRQGSKPCSYAL